MKPLPFQRQDLYGILKAMHDFPVTIRLLDPPLHEFVTLAEEQVKELAAELGTDEEKLKTRIAALHELNPMLGHLGCRLGIAYPEITEMLGAPKTVVLVRHKDDSEAKERFIAP